MSELANRPDPGGWLGAAFERTREVAAETPPVRSFGVPTLRGVKEICKKRLDKALRLTCIELEPEGKGFYRVLPNEESDSLDIEDVNLYEPWGERCHCADFLFRGEALATPCKHILAALIADGNEDIAKMAEDLKRRNAIAAALTGEAA